MRDVKLSEERMWRRSNVMFVAQYNREKDRQQFKYQLEEHMDMISGTIQKCEMLFPMPRIELKIKS